MYFIYTCQNDDAQCNNFKLNNKKGDKIITHITTECEHYTSDHAYCANQNYPEKLEYVKFRERMDFAIELLKEKFPGVDTNSEAFMHEASEIARTLFVRSEIQYSSRKE